MKKMKKRKSILRNELTIVDRLKIWYDWHVRLIQRLKPYNPNEYHNGRSNWDVYDAVYGIDDPFPEPPIRYRPGMQIILYDKRNHRIQTLTKKRDIEAFIGGTCKLPIDYHHPEVIF
jgi:hypothetical protein